MTDGDLAFALVLGCAVAVLALGAVVADVLIARLDRRLDRGRRARLGRQWSATERRAVRHHILCATFERPRHQR